MLGETDRRTVTLRWETEVCPRCKERTTYWLVTDRVSRCSQCDFVMDRSRGLGLDPGLLDEE